eukprot:Ihof_evm4s296 gene=Ihof_evmTU4s296
MSKIKKEEILSEPTAAGGKPSVSEGNNGKKAAPEDESASLGPMPSQALVIRSILSSMGVDDYEPRVVNQLLEFAHRYVADVLEDAVVYSDHAGKQRIDVDDVRLAIQSRVDYSFTGPPPREFMMELAEKRNAVPLPPLKDAFGVHLPPERYWLSTVNYHVAIKKEEESEKDESETSSSMVPSGLARSSDASNDQVSLMDEGRESQNGQSDNPISRMVPNYLAKTAQPISDQPSVLQE